MDTKLRNDIAKYIAKYYPIDVYVKGYIFVTENLYRKLESFIDEIELGFGVSQEEAFELTAKYLKDSPDKLVIINELVEGDEHLNQFTVSELNELKTQIIDSKYGFAREQKYEHAARYRDIELKLVEAIKRKEANNE